MARPMPVLPLVASTTVWPGVSVPSASAASMMASAMRSFTELMGLKASSLTNSSTWDGAMRDSLTTGVRPIVWRMLSYFMGFLARDELKNTGSRQEGSCACRGRRPADLPAPGAGQGMCGKLDVLFGCRAPDREAHRA